MIEPLTERAWLSPATLAPAPTTARWAVAALFFMNGTFFATWVSRIPEVQMARALSHGTIGVALLSMAFGALIAMPLAGLAASRWGSQRVCRVTAVFYGVALPGLALAPGTMGLMLALFCFGAFHGALDVVMNAQAVAVEKRYHRPIMASFHALFSVGGLAGAAAGGLVAAGGVRPLVHFTATAIVIGGSICLVSLPCLLDAGRVQEREMRPAMAKRRSFPRPTRNLVLLGVIAFCVMMGEGAMADWSGIFLRQVTGSTEGLAAAGYAVFSTAMAVGRFFGDELSIRFGPVNMVRMSGALAVSGLTLALTGAKPVVALIGFTAVGAGFATVVPQVFSAAGRAPGMASGTALATVTTLGYFGFLVGPPLIGFAAELIGLRGALAIVIVMSLLMIVLAPSVRRVTK